MTSDRDDTPYRDWQHDLSALQDIGEDILSKWRAENPNTPRDYPSVRWLSENGYSHLRWILKEKHDMGTPEFFSLLTSSGGDTGYEWHIDDVATIGLAKAYLEDQVDCRGWGERTKRTVRSRINVFLQRFAEHYGDAAIVAHANDPGRRQELYATIKQVVKDLREDLSSDESAHKYLRAAHRFTEWLERSNRIKYDPMTGMEDEFNWNIDPEPTPLTDEQVRRLWTATESPEERVLVIGYCIWGVRTRELPAIHKDQLRLNPVDPVISFREEDRKNGQGEVSLMFGIFALARLLDKRRRRPNWNGYLIPSPKSDRQFLSPKQARLKFKNISRRANVTVDGDLATPKHGRSYYYNVLADAETEILKMAAKIADEQGATDPASVRDYYLTPERRQQFRRIFFRQKVREVLPEDAYLESSDSIAFDSSLDDFE